MLKFVNGDNLYFVSDTHYSHRNIVKGLSVWTNPTSVRPFNTIEEMNEWLVNLINDKVPQNGVLFFLGDWAFGHPYEILKFRERLSVKTIHFILGNHDKHIKYNKQIQTERGNIYPQDLFTSIQTELRIKVENQEIYMHHFAHRVWEQHHKGSIHLFAHSHGSLPMLGKSMDVGVDAGGPYSYNEIEKIMEKQVKSKEDYHE
jgi:calcineurin-like phosphoesterase family protein